MSELQGAVGIAQLEKMAAILNSQRKAHKRLAEYLQGISGVSIRPEPKGSEASCDAFVFFVATKELASKVRLRLDSKIQVATKILPEAVSWHFAKHWTHMPNLKIVSRPGTSPLVQSTDLLSKAISLPISRSLTQNKIEAIAEVIKECLEDV